MDFIVRQKSFWSDDDEGVLRAIKEGFIQTHQAMWKELGKVQSYFLGESLNLMIDYSQKSGPRRHLACPALLVRLPALHLFDGVKFT